MLRILGCLALLASLAGPSLGCRKTTVQATYRPQGQDQAMQIDVRYHSAGEEFELLIDRQEILKTRAERRSTIKESAEYKGHRVDLTLTRSRRAVHCVVAVDNEVAGTWDF
jgi:hypothetical protein